MMSAGIDYSQNGGFSANAGGFSYGSGGMSFNPSIGASTTLFYGHIISPSYFPSNDLVSISDSPLKSQLEAEKALSSEGQGAGKHGVRKILL